MLQRDGSREGTGDRRARARGIPASLYRLVRRYGWRAFAVPILSIFTVITLTHGSTSTAALAGASGPGKGAVVERGAHDDVAGWRAGATPKPVLVNLGVESTTCATNTYHQLVLVSITQQHLWACEGSKQVDSTPVTTGSVVHHDQTPVGSWLVEGKQRDRYLVGPGYRDYVHYWVPFNGDFGLHDAPWQTMPFGSPDWPSGGSHGCVHTPTSVMAWLYQWVHVGSTVVTIES